MMKKSTFIKRLCLFGILLVSMPYLMAEVSDPPETLPEAPTHSPGNVKSIFSNYYSDITGVKGFSGPGVNSSCKKVEVLGNEMLYMKEAIQAWAFVELNNTINIDDCDFLCFDIYLVKTDFELKVYFGVAGTTSVIVEPRIQEGWNRVELNLQDYRDQKVPHDLTQINKIGFINGGTSGGGYPRTVYITNIYAYRSGSSEGLTNISQSDTDLVLSGVWNADEFEEFNNSSVTSIDLTRVTGLTAKPETKNPNCLLFVAADSQVSGINVIKNNQAVEGIELQDGNAYNNVAVFETNSISYTRDFKVTGWASICLPFDLEDLPEGIEAYELNKITDNTLNFTSVTSLQADTPYLFDVKTTGQRTFERTTLTSIKETGLFPVVRGNCIFTGAYTKMSGESKFILMSDGTGFGYGTDKSSITPFRSYIEYNGTADIKMFSISNDEGGATGLILENAPEEMRIWVNNGILHISSEKERVINIYSISGQSIINCTVERGDNTFSLSKGIYLLNNRKIVIY